MATSVLDAYVVSSGSAVYAGRFASGFSTYVDDPTYFADDYVSDEVSPGTPQTYVDNSAYFADADYVT